MIPTLIAAAWLLACAALWAWGRRIPPPDEVLGLRTDDGWRLRLHRFRPAPGVPPQPVPVILGHGILMTRFCWELSPALSVPRMLARRGHDVFVAEYRGTPGSRPPTGRRRWGYDARDHAWSDVPAILDCVQRATGAPRASWVGHSMGGLVAYLYAMRFGSDRLARVVTLGSPCRFGAGGAARARLLRLAEPLLRFGRPPLRLLLFLALPFAVFAPAFGSRTAFRLDHLGYRARAALFGGAFADVGGRLHRWFLLLKLGRRVVGDGSEDPLAPGSLARLTAPLLVVAARGDQVVALSSVLPAGQLAGGPSRTVVCGAGRPESPPDFGHNDLMCSAAAFEHVWPEVCRWLERPEPELAA